MRHAWIDEHRDSYPISIMCDVLNVGRSGYYSFARRKSSKRSVRSEAIQQTVARIYEASNGIYGSVKIAKQMEKQKELETACRNTVARAMRQLGLKSRVKKRFTPPTTTQNDPSKQPASNVLDRQFTADRPDQKWVTDITYVRTSKGWVYVAAVLDLFSRKIVGWSVGDSLATELVSEALRKAIENRRPFGKPLLIHSDRGCQYTSDSYQKTLKALGLTCSMSRRGNCYDNAVMERFFWSLKQEWTNHQEYADLEKVRSSLFEYIEMFYNRVRIHQTLDYLSPEQYEAEHTPAAAV